MLKNVPKTVAKYYVRYQEQITSRILKSIVTWQFSYYLLARIFQSEIESIVLMK